MLSIVQNAAEYNSMLFTRWRNIQFVVRCNCGRQVAEYVIYYTLVVARWRD